MLEKQVARLTEDQGERCQLQEQLMAALRLEDLEGQQANHQVLEKMMATLGQLTGRLENLEDRALPLLATLSRLADRLESIEDRQSASGWNLASSAGR